ncbi:hypothetical protein TELCIR_06838 [Teladorsagia circumcincta]|uniref:Uncharacterized protein n=1 Tax=Teladorsagia circumcincta TaxID=45464 RepID=A0A2G9ULY1_TELCI|nr:hypothetical protein TELCIR_06838 [Teladorsagia circumcincta]
MDQTSFPFLDHGHTPFYYRTQGQRLNMRSMKDNAVMNQLMSGQLSRTLLQDLEEDIYDWIHTGNVGKLEELVLTGYGDLLLGRNHEDQLYLQEAFAILSHRLISEIRWFVN